MNTRFTQMDLMGFIDFCKRSAVYTTILTYNTAIITRLLALLRHEIHLPNKVEYG